MRSRSITTLLAVSFAFALAARPAGAQSLKAGFPKTFTGVGYPRTSRLVIANLGLGGKKSVVFGTSGPLAPGNLGDGAPTAGGWLYIVNADGGVPAGWPVQLPSEVNTPAVGDLNGDGVGDVIVVGYGSTFAGPLQSGGVRAVNLNGTTRWTRAGGDFDGNLVPDAVFSTPAIADVDGDGAPEVAWGGYDGYIYLVSLSDGSNKPGWPIFIKDTVYSSPALHDLNGDGKKELIIGVDSHGGGDVVLGTPTPWGGCVWAFQSTGSVMPGFPYCTSMVIWSAPAVGDIDGDGKPEIVFGTGNCTQANGCAPSPDYAYTHKLYAIETDGTNTPGWPVAVDGEVGSPSGLGAAPALADLDADGVPEVIAVDTATSAGQTSKVYLFEGNGTQIAKTTLLTVSGTACCVSSSDPVVGDVTGDSKPEVLVPYNWEAAVVGATGGMLSGGAGPNYSMWGQVSGVAVADMENDGVLEVAVAASRAAFGAASDTELRVWVPKSAAAPVWGAFHQGERRLGVLPGTPAGPAPVPPTVTGVTPSSGTTSGGTSVTVSGTLFQAGASVSVGGTAATGVNVTGPTQLTATTPAHAAGAVAVSVTNPDGGTGSLAGAFTYVAPPLAVTDASPRTGPTGGATLVSLAGTGFQAGATVTFGGASATSVTVLSSVAISARTPSRPIGPADVVVSNPGGGSATLPGGFVYTASGDPASTFTITPCRLIDTRNAAGPFGGPALAPLSVRSFQIPSGSCGIPTDASGVSLNVTVADASAVGNLTMYPGSGSITPTNTISFVPGKNRANNVQIGLVGGFLSVYNDQTSGSVHLIVDVNGYFR